MKKRICAVLLVLGLGTTGGGCIDPGDENPCVAKAQACHHRCSKDGQGEPCHECCTENGKACLAGKSYNFLPCRFKD